MKPLSRAEEWRRAEPERSGDGPTDCYQILGQIAQLTATKSLGNARATGGPGILPETNYD
jgi:hypothetical protein